MRQFLVSRGQVQRLVLERGVVHAQRQDGLHGEDREEDRAAHPPPAAAGLREPGAPGAVPAAAGRGEHPGPGGWLVARQGAVSDRLVRAGPLRGIGLDRERGQHHGLGFRPGERPVAPPARPARRGFRPGRAGSFGGRAGRLRDWAGLPGVGAGLPGVGAGLPGVGAGLPGDARRPLSREVPGLARWRRVRRPRVHGCLTSLSWSRATSLVTAAWRMGRDSTRQSTPSLW